VKVGKRANVRNVTIKIEEIVKSDAGSLMWFARGTDEPATSMEVRLLGCSAIFVLGMTLNCINTE